MFEFSKDVGRTKHLTMMPDRTSAFHHFRHWQAPMWTREAARPIRVMKNRQDAYQSRRPGSEKELGIKTNNAKFAMVF